MIGELVGRGFSVLAHDWRGQGLSDRLLGDPLKGHADNFDDFATDLSLLLDRFAERLPPGPRIALSHSMGGCMTAMALAKGEARIDGAMFSAPMLGIAIKPLWAVRILVWLAARLGAAGQYSLAGSAHPFDATFEENALTHDRARFERIQALILAHRDLALGPVTWGWIESAFIALRRLERSAAIARLAIPVVVVAAGQESLVDLTCERRFAAMVPNGRYLEIPQARHEILMETDEVRALFWREFDALVLRLAPPA